MEDKPKPKRKSRKKLCDCGNPANRPHSCPYQSDINNDDEHECTCCDDCTQACAEDV